MWKGIHHSPIFKIMKYKSKAVPDVAKGTSYKNVKKMVKPNESLSIRDILTRFTRGEPLAVGGKNPQFYESDDDLEKVRHMDLVDREEFINKMKDVQKRYNKQEKDNAEKKAAEQAAAKIARTERRKAERDSIIREARGKDPGAK